MTRDYITNPISINNNYLVLWTGLWTEIIGQKADYMTTVTEKYSYGSGISLQTQPVYYS